jgi:lipopolysaccharide assembly outer membrane protein LptD (OstA)
MIRFALAAIAALALPPIAPGGATTAKFGVWTVHMTVVNYNLKTGNFNTPNHVSMTRVGGDVNADRANGNIKTKNAILVGHVVLHDMSGSFAGGSPVSASGPSTLMADSVRLDQHALRYVAYGNVHYEQGAMVLDAATGTLDQSTHTMTADGDVHIRQGARTLVAQHVSCDTITGACQARHGTVDMPSAGMPGGAP